jgi:hypothetical protein
MICNYCHSRGACLDNCPCQKCVDPERYARWKAEDPWGYLDWLYFQIEDDSDQQYFDRLEEELLLEEGIIGKDERTYP